MLSRRQWLRASATGSFAASTRWLAACASASVSLGAATFEVSDAGALVVVHDDVPGPARLELALPDGRIAAVELELLGDAGASAVVELTELAPATEYRYRVLGASTSSPWYRFETAPASHVEAALRFVFGADIDHRARYESSILRTMAAEPAAFFLSLGDWPYADFAFDARTLDDYHHAHYTARTRAGVRQLCERTPIYAIYDDHEVRNNWDEALRVAEPERVAAALAAWDAWFPVRDRSAPRRRYRSIRWGSLLEIFVLDTRLYRSANAAPDGPDKTMLGAEQKAWLLAGLAASAARFKILATTIPLDTRHGDCWATFRTERDELLRHLVDQRIGGVIALSADQHYFAARHLGVGLKDFQVGPIAQDYPTLDAVDDNVVAFATGYNYGVCTVTPDGAEVAVRDAWGRTLYREVVRPGRGALAVAGPAGREFVVRGAHRFAGAVPARFDNAPPGDYELVLGGAVVDRGELRDGGELVLGA